MCAGKLGPSISRITSSGSGMLLIARRIWMWSMPLVQKVFAFWFSHICDFKCEEARLLYCSYSVWLICFLFQINWLLRCVEGAGGGISSSDRQARGMGGTAAWCWEIAEPRRLNSTSSPWCSKHQNRCRLGPQCGIASKLPGAMSFLAPFQCVQRRAETGWAVEQCKRMRLSKVGPDHLKSSSFLAEKPSYSYAKAQLWTLLVVDARIWIPQSPVVFLWQPVTHGICVRHQKSSS